MPTLDPYLDAARTRRRLAEDWRRHGSLVVAYDFDNTVYDYHGAGDAYPAVVALLHRLRRLGCTLTVFTANPDLAAVRAYLDREGIPFDAVNENPPFYPATAGKIYYNALLDDRAGLRQVYDDLTWLCETVAQPPIEN